MICADYNKWLAAIEHLDAPSKDAFPIIEWSKKLGMSRAGAAEWVRTGLSQGWLERAVTIVEMLNGVQRKTVGFRMTTKKKR